MAITFVLPASIWAETISLVGDFNHWDPQANPLILRENEWEITLELEKGRRYQFRYLLDGAQWCNDWNADQYTAGPLGGDNSIVES